MSKITKGVLWTLAGLALYTNLGALWVHIMYTYVLNQELTTWWQHFLAGGWDFCTINPTKASSLNYVIWGLWFIIWIVSWIVWLIVFLFKLLFLGGLMSWIITAVFPNEMAIAVIALMAFFSALYALIAWLVGSLKRAAHADITSSDTED